MASPKKPGLNERFAKIVEELERWPDTMTTPAPGALEFSKYARVQFSLWNWIADVMKAGKPLSVGNKLAYSAAIRLYNAFDSGSISEGGEIVVSKWTQASANAEFARIGACLVEFLALSRGCKW